MLPWEAAREQLGHLESRIRTIESTLKYAVIIDPTSPHTVQKVKLGARVFVKDLNTGRENSYILVDRFEAQPSKGKISDVFPIGQGPRQSPHRTRGRGEDAQGQDTLPHFESHLLEA